METREIKIEATEWLIKKYDVTCVFSWNSTSIGP
jgi:hypothetical protein